MNDTEVKTLDVLRAVSGTIDSQIQKLEEQDFFKDTDVGPASDHEPDTELEQLLEQEDQTAHEVRKRLKKTDKPEPPSPYPTWIDENAIYVEGKLWIRGNGPLPADYIFVGERPAANELRDKVVFAGNVGNLLKGKLTTGGFDYQNCYFTNAVKYPVPKNKSVQAKDIKVCRPMLLEEIRRCQPKAVVCLGSHALRAVAGKDMGISTIRGEFVWNPNLNTYIYAMHSPAYVLRSPETMPAFEKDIATLTAFQRGTLRMPPKPDWVVLTKASEIASFREWLFSQYANPLLVLDSEWDGRTWMDPERYMRTVQIGYDHGKVVIVELHGEGGVPVMDDMAAAWAEMKALFEDERVSLIGHNIIADGEWLLSYGVDIRPRVVWDTMLAEYLLHESGPFDLGEVAIKYTDYGRYSMPVELWVKAHPDLCRAGYGHVPRDLLLPYGAIDVDAPRKAFEQQAPRIEAEGFLRPRGANGEFPSLWYTTLRTQEIMYELQGTGMLVDKERLAVLIDAYQEVRKQLHGVITTEAAVLGKPTFNPASAEQVRQLLFGTLQLPPVKTTEGRAWGDQVGNTGMDSDADYKASTDKTTLEILQDFHPIVEHLLQFRRIDQACKTWLRWPKPEDNEASTGGGVLAKVWPDGRLHSRFSPLTETGRFRTSKPNAQNWPKKAEGYMLDIFGGPERDKSKVPPGLRTIVIPPPGHVMMEADFCQAELFVLAALSGDPNMWAALTTPGRDLHDLTAINAFKLRVVDLNGREVPEQELVDMAAQLKDQGGAESKEFKAFQKTLTYIDGKGHRMTRDQFKSTIRVSAKNVNFGIPYGRGAGDIARQVKAETGSTQTVAELEAELSEIVRAWKEETYPTAWEYMCNCAAAVYDPGYLINPWGRKRRFMINPGDNRADMERQAQNYPIQSTVADTAMLAMDRIVRYRQEHDLHFRIQNQIHDAVMLEVPIPEIDACKKMFQETMANIDIPVGGPFKLLRLGVDIEVFKRWGEKSKD